jgi:hypothetical protein
MTDEKKDLPVDVSEAVERGRVIWDDLISKWTRGPLPFVVVGPDGEIMSAWSVVETGNPVDDLALGACYAHATVLLAKHSRNFKILSDVLVAIVQKGNPGIIERGFLDRIAMLAVAAAQN